MPAWEGLWHLVPDAEAADHPHVALGVAEVLGLRGEPALAVVTDEAGTWQAALALRRTTTGPRPLPVRTLSGAGTWHLPAPSVLINPAAPAGTLQALGALLMGTRAADICDLRFAPPTGRLDSLLAAQPSPDGESRQINLRLPEIHRERSAWRFRKYAARLGRRGHYSADADVPVHSIPRVIEALAHHHTSRWAAHGPAAEFRDAAVRTRLASWAVRAREMGLLRVAALELDGEVIAAHLSLSGKVCRVGWRVANADTHADLSLGRLVTDLAIRQAQADGLQQFSLGRGSDSYKSSWVTTTVPLARWAWASRRLASLIRRAVARTFTRRAG